MTLKKVFFFSLITNQLTIFLTSYFQRSVQRLFSTSDGSCKSFVQNPSEEIEMVVNHHQHHLVTSSVSKNEAEEKKLHSATIVKGKRVNYPSNDCQVRKKGEREKRKRV